MKKVLIVEDDYDIGEIAEMTLSTKYDVLVLQDSVHLKEALEEFRPNVILIDNYIGKKNAKEIISDLSSAGISLAIPLILFSAHHAIATIAEEIGAAGFIPKPFDLDELHQCVQQILVKHES